MFRIGNHFVSTSVALLLVIEYLICVAAALGGRSLHADSSYLAKGLADQDFSKALLIGVAISVSMMATGMYQGGVRDGLRKLMLRMVPAGLLSCGLMVLLFDKGPPMAIDTQVVSLTFLLAAIGILATRAIFYESLRSPFLRSRILFLGAGKERGLVVLPEVGDEVLVAFGQDDMQQPYILGGLYNGKDKTATAVIGVDFSAKDIVEGPIDRDI